MTAPHTTATTDPQSIVAALQQRLDAALARETTLTEDLAARDAALAQRNSEFGERIEHQAATIDVLKAMSASPGDAQPVFDLIVQRATELCNVPSATLFEYDGELVHIRSDYRSETILAPSALAAYVQRFPMRPTRGSISCRAILDRQILHVQDLRLDRELAGFTRELGHRSQVSVPLIRDDLAIGVITIGAQAAGGFSDSQVELLKTFAEQAVIAITSAETYRALQTRTSDLQQSLEYQTATSDVLKVISRSTFDLQPVLDTLVETAARLCNAEQAAMARPEGNFWRLAANFGFPAEYEAYYRATGVMPYGPDAPPSVTARAVREKVPVHIHDVAAIPGYPDLPIRLGKQRTSLAVPLLREGQSIGVILLGRQRVEPFTDRQIELVRTFADQAVIAIENTRLITEQREALEQQTATAEVLQVINASPGDLAPVFDAMLERALRLCGAAFGALHTYDGERFQVVALRGIPTAFAAIRRDRQLPTDPDSRPGQMLVTGRPVQLVDAMTDPYFVAHPNLRDEQIDLGGVRSALNIPLLKDGTVVGAFVIYRKEPGVWPDKQVALLESFAAQAVIAMENARLLTEQQEALEQQTATAEVLQVINASPGNLAPVFDAMLEKAMRLCGGTMGGIFTFDGDHSVTSAVRGVTVAFQEYNDKYPIDKIQPGTVPARIIETGGPVQNPDLSAGENYRAGHPYARALVELGGIRAVLAVPLLKDGVAVGMVAIYRREAGAFSDKEIALLENFAAQAVIAMENARLITEQQQALEQQTATAEVLQVINASPGNLSPVFDAILEKAHSLCGAAVGALMIYDGQKFHAAATHGFPEQHAALVRQPFAPSSQSSRLLIQGERFVHLADMKLVEGSQDDEVHRSGIENAGVRTGLAVPLRKDGNLLGYISAFRLEVRPYSDREIALLENFAAQAVIAMENARLLTEQREALEQQTATAEVLQVINSSPGDLEPVFSAILEKATWLCDTAFGALLTYDGELWRPAAVHGPAALAEFFMNRPPWRPAPERGIGRHIVGEDIVHFADLAATDLYGQKDPGRSAYVELGQARTAMSVALRKDDILLGAVQVYRQEVRSFAEREIALLQNFAAQAVIAMENARLLTEQREALDQQTATAEVLQVINASPGDLVPVFDTILEKAHRLCGAALGSIVTFDGEYFRAEVTRGYPEEYAALMRQGFRGRPQSAQQALVEGERFVHVTDWQTAGPWRDDEVANAFIEATGVRTFLVVPLSKDGSLLGFIGAHRQEVRAFTDKEISLLENFAAQAVIAMENARLLADIRQRQEELRITFENMGDGVAMFDETPRLVAWNRKFQEMLDVPDAVLAEGQTYAAYIRYLTERGEYGPGADAEAQLQHFQQRMRRHYSFERTRPDGRVIEVRHNPVLDGGFVLIYADITERKRSEAELRAARDAAEEASRMIEAAYRELKTAQANLIQAEKMASLGQLTAGIAHEIKNPLNFVNNFAALSVDLLSELKETAAPGFAALTDDQRAEIEDLSATLTSNLEKITEHGKRADSIVKAMLEHSRGSSGERRTVDLNALIDEALNLAYHGARAQDQSFNITLERDFDEGIAPIEVNPQDMTRVFLNLFANGFYAVTRRARDGGDAAFEPTLIVATSDADEAVEIRVRDNGTGIPADIGDKLFQPFFTTKPTGEGTGLGLSITYDIVTQQHGGSITVDSQVGKYSQFMIRLPRKP